ncbi:hypothetical protein [Limobrevibacterium gyesilva]|uniref:Lipoprotein n=1 Tax=Limobrevibacterium gyesilva TaxID=2991712 RepID=A0AA41YPY1_9PROT|nr:hypothetical protein [Limobrevibacterium gyesilva]MCW3476098.1 hypothetical protein [Limobrevibacterium gyesilva]
MSKTPIFVAGGLALLVCACTRAQVADKENLMAMAGFRPIPATSPEGLTALNALPPHEFSVRVQDGRQVYLFADPLVCKCVYSGSTQQYAAYLGLLAEERLRAEQELRITMDRINGPSGASE